MVRVGRVAGIVVFVALWAGLARATAAQAGPPPCAPVPGLEGWLVTALAPAPIGDETGLLVGTDRGLWLVRLGRQAGEAEVLGLPLPRGPAPITALATSEDGAAWIATERGIFYHPATCPGGASCPFRSWSAEAGELPFRTVLAVTADGFIGGPRGVARWDGQAWQRESGAPGGVTALLRLGDRVWAATRAGRLWLRDPSGAWRAVLLPGQAPGRALLALSGQNGRLLAAGEAGMWVLDLDEGGEVRRVARITDVPLAALAVGQGQSVLAGSGVAAPRQRPASCRTVPIPNRLVGLQQFLPPAGEPVTAIAPFAGALWVGTPRGLYVYGPSPRWAPEPPRQPVMLIPGLYGAADVQKSQLKFLARALRADGYPVVYVGSLRPDRPLEANAAQLYAELQRVRAQTGATGVWLVGHSYGGLVAEAMVRLYGAQGVAGVATLGTPHAGMWLWADMLAAEVADGTADAGVADVLPLARARQPAQVPPVPRLAVAGDLLPQADSPLLQGLPAGDGLVAAPEALAMPGALRRTLPLAHGWNLRLLELGVPTLTGPQNEVYWDVLRPWLRGEEVPPAWQLAPPKMAEPRTPTRWEVIAEGSLASSRGVTATLPLEAGDVRHVVVSWRGPRPRTWLVAPDGERLADDRVPARDDVAVVPFEAVGLRPVVVWSVQAQAGGTWQFVVQNQGEGETNVRVLAVAPPGVPGLDVRVTPAWGAPGQEVRVRVQVPASDPADVVVRWQGRSVAATPTGPQAFQARLRLPETPGLYAFEVRAGPLVRFVPVGVRGP